MSTQTVWQILLTIIYIHKDKQQVHRPYHSFEDNFSVCISSWIDNTRTVNQIDPTHQSDILPNLGGIALYCQITRT